jgi:hypothetical protein
MYPGISDGPSEPVRSGNSRPEPDHRVGMADVKQWVEAGRQLLRENPRLSEVEFRERMLDRFRANDQRLQQDRANLVASPGNGMGDGVFALFALPWSILRWLGWRGRLARHRAEMDEVVGVLRAEGHFASAPA